MLASKPRSPKKSEPVPNAMDDNESLSRSLLDPRAIRGVAAEEEAPILPG